MFDSRASRTRSSSSAYGLALGSIILGLVAVTAVAVEALANHPGSNARRIESGMIRVEAVALLADSCTRIASIRAGAPTGEPAPASGSIPVTLRLSRATDDVCAAVVGKGEAVIEVDARPAAGRVHLYTLGPDDRLLATQRIPIR